LNWVEDPAVRREYFVYDAAGRLVEKTLADGRKVRFGYDARGNVVSVTPPGRPEHRFEYDSVGRLVTYRPPQVPGSGETRYIYDLDGKLIRVERPDGQTVEAFYDAGGRLVEAAGGGRSNALKYDSLTRRLSGLESSDGVNIALGWDGHLLTSENWSGLFTAQVKRKYDENFRVIELDLGLSGAGYENPVRYQYDSDGLLTRAGAMTLTRERETGFLQGTQLGQISTGQGYNRFG